MVVPKSSPSADEIRGRGAPGVAPQGCGPGHGGTPKQKDDHHPSAGWGAAKSVGKVLFSSGEVLAGTTAMLKMNHENGGFDCPGCAWPDDRNGLHLDLCENGIKHTTWEMTKDRVDREFFSRHTVTELSGWSDYALEKQGRLTEPMAYDSAQDKYVPISWPDAFALVGNALRALPDPNAASFYTSGRLSNEATFLYQLWAREFGTNNLPDCSNMCHEASGRALQAAIGTGKGTADIDDWDAAELIVVMGVNAASNAPRMLTALGDAYRRGAQIVHVNPLKEAASRRTIVPHEFAAMATFHPTRTGTLDIQPRIGGDLALLRGVAKTLFELYETDPTVIDMSFVSGFTEGFEDYRSLCLAEKWSDIVHQSGVAEADIRHFADLYRQSSRTIISWCLGLTQQEHAVDTVREIVNVLLLKANIGRPGTGPSPVRGHSNVQGNRSCGIDHRPTTAFLDALAAACDIEPPRAHGLDTVGTIEAMHQGTVKVFVGMGGNFAMATPDPEYTFDALRRCELTVQVSTKLNRSHLVHGKNALILPCIGRTERDEQRSGPQSISVEDAMSRVHLSRGSRKPPSPQVLSEPAIIAGLAHGTLPASTTDWQAYVDDYDRIRDTMARVIPGFADFNLRVRERNGFRIAQAARLRNFDTPSCRAEFSSAALGDVLPPTGYMMLGTMRSHDQWNTTIYSDNDRYRGVKNLRTLVFMNRADIDRLGLREFGAVDITSYAKDGSTRTVYGYTAVAYDIPAGNAAGYMPELNVLCPIGDYSEQSGQPLMKHLTVKIVPASSASMV
ncbi:FdhF/YdeP family oxidoreductase [Rhodococcus sp. P1Y]|uniref:FdhF/YdeP family oxidoreductase n=1 Tax=Rhodococcus sp. P1Y TaxID=1302308 RepID=UPI000EAF638F|nr:FdhF/YdeP family oxidoreductase [Rhodococcus sp. P1Y]AYJ50264.1 formate dehydrogenase [Rhodococcus sp. P1Y]